MSNFSASGWPYLALLLLLLTPGVGAVAQTVVGSVDITGQPLGQVAVNPATDRVYVGGVYSLGGQPLTVIDASDETSPSVVTTVTGAGATVNPNRVFLSGCAIRCSSRNSLPPR